VHSLNLNTGAVKTLGRGDLRATDDHYVVTITGRNQLLLLDRRTRKQRVLVDGHRAFEIALVSSSVAVHDSAGRSDANRPIAAANRAVAELSPAR
jgi:hypothetical protein